MLFSSLSFIFVFLTIFLILYFKAAKINPKFSRIILIIMSIFFYCYSNYKLAFYLIGSIVVNSIIGYILSKKKKKFLLGIGVVLNIGQLLLFKFYNFFINNFNYIFSTHVKTLNILVPLGISFVTFKYVSSLVEIYKHDSCKLDIINYISYISFFPQIISGPISQYYIMDEALKQKDIYKFNIDNFSSGLFLFSSGLIKKVLIAGNLLTVEKACLNEHIVENSTLALMGMLAYSLELYFDFSGYSDMANGISSMINIQSTKNFDSPYRATSISDFWKRWHISLTQFLTKYVYIPLGGNRKGTVRTYINIFIVFLISGIWHGAAWTFIIWGVLHGTIMIIERFLSKAFKSIKIPQIIGRIYTFITVNILWLIFNSNNMYDVKRILHEIGKMNFTLFPKEFESMFTTKTSDYFLSLFGIGSIAKFLPYFWVIIALVISQLPQNSDAIASSGAYAKKSCFAIAIAFLTFLSVISMSTASSFIYWSF